MAGDFFCPSVQYPDKNLRCNKDTEPLYGLGARQWLDEVQDSGNYKFQHAKIGIPYLCVNR